MKKTLGSWLATVAVILASALGINACSDDPAALPQLLLLLEDSDGPSTVEAVGFLEGWCGESCDNDISAVTSGAARGTPIFTGIDDDLTVLSIFLMWLTWDHPGVDEMYENLNDYLIDLFGGETEGVETYSSVSGLLSLDDLCVTGSGFGIYTSEGEVEITSSGDSAGAKGSFSVSYPSYFDTYVLSLSNCVIEGNFTDETGDEQVALSGLITLTEDYEDGDHDTAEVTGNIVVNPGVIAAGTGPTIVWGANTPMALGAEAERLNSADGGFCYDGATPTEDDCEGIFLSSDGDDVSDMIFLNFPE